jgi:hypothetical protein
MKFSESGEEASPEIINKFLDSVKHFEEAFEKAETKKVIEILKNPLFMKADELTPEEISAEINNVLDIYAKNYINIDVIEKDDVSEKDFYKFLTEELPQQETEFVNIEGMTCNFIYEEFHPNDKLNAKDSINFFLRALLDNDIETIELWSTKEKFQFNGSQTTLPEFTKYMRKQIPGKATDSQTTFLEFEFGGQNNVKVDFIVNTEELIEGKLNQSQISLHLIFGLQRSEFGGFEIISCCNISD